MAKKHVFDPNETFKAMIGKTDEADKLADNENIEAVEEKKPASKTKNETEPAVLSAGLVSEAETKKKDRSQKVNLIQTSIYIPKELYKKMKIRAAISEKDEEKTHSSIMCLALERYFAETGDN